MTKPWEIYARKSASDDEDVKPWEMFKAASPVPVDRATPDVPTDTPTPMPFSVKGLGTPPRRGLAPAEFPLDVTDDVRAQRGFGRSAYMSDGTEPQMYDGGMIRPDDKSSRGPIEDDAAPETWGQLADRLTANFAAGATPAIASFPERIALMQSMSERSISKDATGYVNRAVDEIREGQRRLDENPSMSDEARTRIVDVQRSALKTIESYLPIAEGSRLAGEIQDADKRPIYAKGAEIEEASQRIFGKPDPTDDRMSSKVSQGFGSFLGVMANTIAGTFVGGPTGGLIAGGATAASMNSASMYKEAKSYGATEDEALKAAKIADVVGLGEMFPIGRMLEIVPAPARGRVTNALLRRIVDGASSATEESIQEAAAAVANNLTAAGIFDPERGTFKDVGEQVLIGAIVGGSVGATISRDRSDGGQGRADGEPEKIAPLSESDLASPVPNDILAKGKTVIDRIASGEARPATRTPTAPNYGVAPLDDPGGLTARVPQPEAKIAAPRVAPLDPAEPAKGEVPLTSLPSERNLSEPFAEVDGDTDTGRTVQLDLDTGEIVEATEQGILDDQARETAISQAQEPVAATAVPSPLDTVANEGLPAQIAPRQPITPPKVNETSPRVPTVQKKPLAQTMKGVGVKPGSPLAQELNARGIDGRSHPGLFRGNGATDWDNIPAADYQDIATAVGEDGNGYLDQNGLIDALDAETRGDLLPIGEQAMLRAARDAKDAQSRFEDATESADPIDVSAFEGARSYIPSPDIDISTPLERGDAIRRDINAALTETQLSGILTSQEQIEIFDGLDKNGGNAEDAIWNIIHRGAEIAAPTQDAGSRNAQSRGQDAAAADGGRSVQPAVNEGSEVGGQSRVENDQRRDVGQAGQVDDIRSVRSPETNAAQPASTSGYDQDSPASRAAVSEIATTTAANTTPADAAQRLKAAKATFKTLDADKKIPDAQAYMKASTELSDARDAFAADLAQKGGRVELRNDGNTGAAITPMGDGFQITYFDKRGMSGDTQHKTLDAAIKDAVGQGYDQPAPGYMKALKSGKEWVSPTKFEEVRKQAEGTAVDTDAKPKTLEDYAPKSNTRASHVYAEMGGERFYIGTFDHPSKAEAEIAGLKKSSPDAGFYSTDRADGTSINGDRAAFEKASTQNPATEQTDAGEQQVIPGVEPVTQKARLEAAQSKPLDGGNAEMRGGRDSLFGDPMGRADLFDAPAEAKAGVQEAGQATQTGMFSEAEDGRAESQKAAEVYASLSDVEKIAAKKDTFIEALTSEVNRVEKLKWAAMRRTGRRSSSKAKTNIDAIAAKFGLDPSGYADLDMISGMVSLSSMSEKRDYGPDVRKVVESYLLQKLPDKPAAKRSEKETLLADKPKSKTQTRLEGAYRKAWTEREDLPDGDDAAFVEATKKVRDAGEALEAEYGADARKSALEEIEAGYQSKPDQEKSPSDNNAVTENTLETKGSDQETPERVEDLGEKIGGARKDTSVPTGPRKSTKAKDERPASQRRYQVSEVVADNFNKGRVGKFTIDDTRSKYGRIKGFGRGKLDFDTREEAEAAIPFVAVSRNHRVVKRNDEFEIIRDVTDRKRPTVKGGFKTREEAMAYMAANAEEIAETKLRIDDNIHPALDEAIRKGDERRENGRDVTGQDFMDVFGFRGVEFGNWNNNAERRHLLNQAYDAFLDMAEITGMSPKALSLHGEMGLAFGARGHGLQGARAHYERNYGVINLTKIKGAGSLAHEWFHAMDHYFARQDGKASPRNLDAKEGEPIYDPKTPREDYVSHGFRYKSGMREEVRNEIKNVMSAISKRKAEYTEDQSTREKVSKRQIDRVKSVLDGIEKALSTAQSYGKKKAPATEAQMKRFKQAALKIRAAKDLGEMVEAPTKATYASFQFYKPVMEIAEIYKEVRGRQAYGQTQGRRSGYAVDLQNAIEARNQAQQFLDDAKAEKVKEKTVASEFYSEAWKLDQGSAKDYWSTNHELAARAFESFVYDRLKDVDARNDFLAYEKRNDLPEYKLFGVKPYPEGQERKDINAAFEKLFEVIESKDDGDAVMLYQRPLDMFYSPMLKAVSSAKQTKAPAKDWKAIIAKLPGVKKVEMEWLGVDEWLDTQEGQQVPREALVEFIRDSQIEIVEDRLGERHDGFEVDVEILQDDEMSDGWSEADIEEQVLADAEQDGTYSPAQHESYTEDGGDNYREVLLRVPDLHKTGANKVKPTPEQQKRWDALNEKIRDLAPRGYLESDDPKKAEHDRAYDEREALAEEIGYGKSPFVQSHHFDQENIVVHARVKDRQGANGEKVLFVEEIQSDLASVWRENQESPEVTAKRREMNEDIRRLEKEKNRVSVEITDILRDAATEGTFPSMATSERSMGGVMLDVIASQHGGEGASFHQWTPEILEWSKTQSDLVDKIKARIAIAEDVSKLRDERNALGTEKSMDPSTPDTPFKQEHTYNLMVKRLLRMAAEGGYDRLSWTPGYMQAERWNAAAQSVVEEVEWSAPDAGSVEAANVDISGYRYVNMTMADGGNVVDMSVDPTGKVEGTAFDQFAGKQLSQIVGPGVAKQIMSEPTGNVSGQKITFPDSGYAIAYDQQTKRAVDKFAKKFGARVQVDKTLPDFKTSPKFARMEGNTQIFEQGENNPVWSIDITPDLREAAMEPMSMFRRTDINAKRGTSMALDGDLTDLRAEMDKMGLKEVDLALASPDSTYQGALRIDRKGGMTMLIGASMDKMNTLRHEAIHALRAMNLFTQKEWATLSQAAEGWIGKHGIAERYPDLSRLEQIEEAIAEEFGAWNGKTGGAFAKIRNFLDALGNFLRGRGFSSVDDIFDMTASGEIGMRPRGMAAKTAKMNQLAESDLLSLPGESKSVGPEVTILDSDSLKITEADYTGPGGQRSFRYVAYEDGKPVGVLQFRTAGPRTKKATIQNVYVARQMRRQKIAASLLKKAREDFDVRHSTDLSDYGRLWKAADGVKYQRPAMSDQGRATTAQQTNTAHIPAAGVYNASQKRTNALMRVLSNTKGDMADKIDRFRVLFQDQMIHLRRAEEMIAAHTGQDIDKEDSAYYAEERYSGRVGKQLDVLRETYIEPIAQEVGRNAAKLSLVDHNGETRKGAEAVSLYLWARHAKERNKRIRDIKGGDSGSGLTDAQANAILKRAQISPTFAIMQKVGKLTDQLGSEMIDTRVAAGLLTKQEAQIWKAQYKHYVPLKGFAETDMFDAVGSAPMAPRGRRFNVAGKESKMALGRDSESFDQLSNMIAQAEEVIVRSEKNIVGKTLYDLIQSNPAPGIWEIKDLETRKVYNKASGRVETQILNAAQVQLQPDEMAVKIDGEEKRIKFNDPRLARALGQLGVDGLGPVARLASKFSRYFSAVNTMLSPPFVIVNGFRDMITAQFNLGQLPPGIRGKLRRKANPLSPAYWKSMGGVYSGLGKGAKTSEYAKWFKEFEEVGAKVSFWNIENPQARKDTLERMTKNETGGKLRRALRKGTRLNTEDNPVLGWIERVNLMVDNSTRLAVYVEARNQGMSKAEAASLSKNLTVNFNRRGELGATMNAWYPFANAAVQGSHVLLKAAKSRNVQALMGGAFMTGFLNEMLNATLSEEDEDGELTHDKIPNYISERNLIISTGGNSRITIPLPYGFNVPFYAGQQMAKVWRGVKPPGEATGHVASATFASFSPIAGEDVASTLAPTLLDHVRDLDKNEDWQGRPIRPEQAFGDYGPQSYKEWNVPSYLSITARALNNATGGSPIESGAIDISPEYMHHTLKFLGGGAARFLDRATDTATKVATGEEIEGHRIPLLRVVRYEPSDWLNQGRYFEFREVVEESRAAAKTAKELRIPIERDRLDAAGLYGRMRKAEKARKALSKQITNIYANDALTERQRREKVKPLQDQRNKVYEGFNREFIRAMGPQSE